MGNLCSKSANQPDSFSGQGRVLGSSSATQPSSAPVPQKISASTPGRTLGGDNSPNDARSAAAKAAEERAAKAKNSNTGKLGSQLAAQKQQTRAELLAAGSQDERQARDADANAEARNWN